MESSPPQGSDSQARGGLGVGSLAIPAAYLAVLAFDAERVGLWHVLAAGNVAGLVLFGVWTWRGRFFRVPDEASR